jgi:hypothetical protein
MIDGAFSLSYDHGRVVFLSKMLIVISLTALLRCSSTFRTKSREFDEQAFAALKQAMRVMEDSGYPPQLVPLLILLTALSFMLSLYLTTPAGR